MTPTAATSPQMQKRKKAKMKALPKILACQITKTQRSTKSNE